MNSLSHIFSRTIHCIVAVLFLLGSFGLQAAQVCDGDNPCVDSEITSCCSPEKEETAKKEIDCCKTTHSENEDSDNHQTDHLCQCCTISKNLVTPIILTSNEVGIKTNLHPGDLNSFFSLLLISKLFHPPNFLSVS